MQLYKQRAKQIIDPRTEIHYAVCTSYKGTKFPHSHDFYELLLIIAGQQMVTINNNKLLLKENSLLLIRPNDIHTREYISEGMHINVAFPTRTADQLFHYLGEGFRKELLLNLELPPHVVLSPAEKTILQHRLENLNLIEIYETQVIRTQLRILLFDLLTKYLTIQHPPKGDMPKWLLSILREMSQRENFIRGIPAMIELSGRSHEYLCRSFHRYLNLTPTDYINSQRLNYAANLLQHSDMGIIDICMEAGFDNVSHFYHLFKKTFDSTPTRYRNQTQSIPL